MCEERFVFVVINVIKVFPTNVFMLYIIITLIKLFLKRTSIRVNVFKIFSKTRLPNDNSYHD